MTDPISLRALGRSAGIIMMVGAAIGLPLTAVLTPEHRGASEALAVLAIIVGAISWRVPWDRLPRGATLLIPLYGFISLAFGIYLGKRSETFALFFVVIFAWTGIAHGPGMCLKLAPVGLAAYAVPVAARGGGLDETVLAAYFVPVAVMTGEGVAWLAGRLRATESGLRESDQLRNEFIAMVAHDMRTAITVISGFTHTLRTYPEQLTDAQREDFLQTIDRNAKRASEFVENLLQFARIEANEFRHAVVPFDIGALARRVVGDAEGPDHHGRFVLRIALGLPPALGDEDRNAQVLGNLLSNALKYSPPHRPIFVDIAPGDDEIRVSVTDGGPGVKDEVVPRLFQKFATFEADDDQKRAAGTGLGLYICRRLVEAQNGRIWLESPPEGGARFVYTVPVGVGHEVVSQNGGRVWTSAR